MCGCGVCVCVCVRVYLTTLAISEMEKSQATFHELRLSQVPQKENKRPPRNRKSKRSKVDLDMCVGVVVIHFYWGWNMFVSLCACESYYTCCTWNGEIAGYFSRAASLTSSTLSRNQTSQSKSTEVWEEVIHDEEQEVEKRSEQIKTWNQDSGLQSTVKATGGGAEKATPKMKERRFKKTNSWIVNVFQITKNELSWMNLAESKKKDVVSNVII